MIDARSIDWRLPATLGGIVVLDELFALGALGVAPRSAAPLGPRILVALLAVGVLSASLGLARATWLRTAFAARHPWLWIASIALSVQIGLSMSRRTLPSWGVLERTIGLPVDEFIFLTATTTITLLFLDALRRHRELMNAMLEVRARLSAAQEAATSGLAEERAHLTDRVRDLLEHRLGPTSMRAALFTPDRLKLVADELLRPLAHQLADATSDIRLAGPPPRSVRVREVLRRLGPMPVLRPGLLAATMGLLVFRFSITPPPSEPPVQPGGGPLVGADEPADLVLTVQWSSLGESLALHAATVLVVLLGARWLARWLATRPSREEEGTSAEDGARLVPMGELVRAWTVTGATLVVLGLVSLTLLRIVFGLPGWVGLPPLTLGVAIGFTSPLLLVTIVLSVLPAAEDALAGTRVWLARANDELSAAVARANALLDHERRLFARNLHASVQAAVNAASLTIERATVDGAVDADVVARAAARIDAAVERLRYRPSTTEHGDAEGSADLDARLAAIEAT